jgi:hypothetical protein
MDIIFYDILIDTQNVGYSFCENWQLKSNVVYIMKRKLKIDWDKKSS